MRCAIWASVGMIAAASCSKKSADGLPPATDWQAEPAAEGSAAVPPLSPPPGMAGRDRDNPHAGLDMDGDPADPHAGLDMTGAADNPHAGVDMAGGSDVTKLGLAAPDPDRPIDPTHRVAGVITVDPKLKDRVKSGTAVFVIVKRAGPDGAPSGPPLAVDKLTWSGDHVAFELTEAQAMVAGTDLTGSVVVTARYDQDGDALSREPGDVTGQVGVKIPADHVKLTLDTVLP